GAGSSELVIDDVNGYTFTGGDVEELTDRIRKVLHNSENATKMGANGFDSARQSFVDTAIKKLSDIFNDTLRLYPSKSQES
ncbi:MAG TPA: hypothetical protein VJ044_15135, partial [Candidatus Hodarchaeales archaeon]|nr:hypothetical protein [Candidatus Hodarchaeales archaeon]